MQDPSLLASSEERAAIMDGEVTEKEIRIATKSNDKDGPRVVVITESEYSGLSDNSVKTDCSFPTDADLKGKDFDSLPTISKIEYDTGTHLRCMQVHMSDGTKSEKLGNFSLQKTMDLTGKEVGKIEVQTISQSSDGKIGRVAFFDRANVLICEIKGSYTLSGTKTTIEIKPTEKLCGIHMKDSAYVMMGMAFKVAIGGKPKVEDKVLIEIQDPSKDKIFEIVKAKQANKQHGHKEEFK